MDDPLQGQILSGYRIERRLARSEGESLYLATQVAVARKVALKVLSPEAAEDRSQVVAFVERARRAGKLKSRGLVELHEVGQQGDYVFSSMEYLPGGSLQQWIERRGPFSSHALLALMEDVLAALEYVEKQGVVHGRIRPEHLLFTRDGRLKLLHPALGDPEAPRAVPFERWSPHELAFVAPEELRPGPIDTRTDIYCLGCTWHHALSGRVPFWGETPAEVLSAKRLHRFASLKESGIDAAPELIDVVETRMMALSPERRLRSFSELRSSLEPLERERAAIAAPLLEGRSRTFPRWREVSPPARAVLGSLPLVAAFIVALVVFLSPGQRPEPQRERGTEERVVAGGTGDSPASEGAARHGEAAPSETEGSTETPRGEPGAEAGDPSAVERELGAAQTELAGGEYAKAAERLEKLKASRPEAGERARGALEEVEYAARVELDSAAQRARGFLELRGFSKAEDALRSLAPRLPPSLGRALDTKLAELAGMIGEVAIAEAKEALVSSFAELDFAGAERVIEGLRREGRVQRLEEIRRLETDLGLARDLWEELDATKREAWKKLRDRFRADYLAAMKAPGGEASFESFRRVLLRSATALTRDELEASPYPHLFRGAAREVEGGLIEVTYDFSSPNQLGDLVPATGFASSIALGEGSLHLEGERRLLEGDPFRETLDVSLGVSLCDPDAPNINVALWTRHGDPPVTYRGDTRQVDGELARWGYLAFVLGYQPESRLKGELKSRVSGAGVLFPCHAIIEGRRGFSLHEDLRYDCVWGENYLSSNLRKDLGIVVAYGRDRVVWSVSASGRNDSLGARLEPAVVEALRFTAPDHLSGSVTIFTNGKLVEIKGMKVTAKLEPRWVDERLGAAAIHVLSESLPAIPWAEVDLRAATAGR